MFNNDQIEALEKPILAERVKSREAYNNQKLSYIAGHTVIDIANDIFGFGNWDTEILALKEIHKQSYIKPPYNSGDKEKPMFSVAYLCNMRLTVRDADGNPTVKEDTGFGDGSAGDTPAGIKSALELASKEAVTDAIKRCFRHFGNQFGNSLYDKDGSAPIDAGTYEATKVVTAEALVELSKLLDKRGVDEDWAIKWLEGEGWTEPLTALRQDWYDSLYKAVDNIGAAEREAEEYVAKFDNLVRLR